MRTPLLLAVLLAVALAGCEPSGRTLSIDPPLLQSKTAVLPPKFQKVKPLVRTPPVVVARGEGREAVAPAKRHVTAGDPAWAAGIPAKWTHIIVHHAAMESGNAETIDRLHRQQKWDELGYHFVIDNGNGGAGGKIEIGSRWIKQKHGAHCRPDPNDANYWNEHGIGICLVGNFETHKPSDAQMASAARLVVFLMEECDIPRQNILGHGQVPGADTACPGRQFPYDDLFRRIDALMRD